MPAAAVAAAGLLALGWAGWQLANLPRLEPDQPLLVLPALLALLGAVAALAAALALRPAADPRLCQPPGSATAEVPVQPVQSAQPVQFAPPRPDEPRLSDTPAGSLHWQIELLQQLPGVGLLLQPAASDWIVIAVHRGPDAVDEGPQAWPDLPGGLSHERLQPLSALLSAHPDWPADVILATLEGRKVDRGGEGDGGDNGDDRDEAAGNPTAARRLPLPEGACLLWLPPAAQPRQAGQTPQLGDRESIAYSVSHDLRAPIRVIEGFTRIVREDYGAVLDRVGNDHLDRVLGAAARMNSMIDALLALSRLTTQTLVRETVPLSELAGQIAQELQAQAPHRRVEFDLQPGLSAVGDPALLRSMLENLLGNAWKYSARREVARIGLRRELRQPPGAAAAQPVFVLCDNGAGFDMRFADRLFSPFQRLHSASEFAGNGVGLASVRRIVLRHGGQIWAESEVDRGSCFYFTLPG